ncbi:cullin homog, putative [Eimeria tenella]|uniref:Cullin homog, putative n=1 Tax=Eimeria tenella TaxID=5802 RepID=U6KUS5_EIMTE|nr:cullin homog, putative [Eimeria tenella]CDJ41897.1 cullin homog, putative [Eimeria tenella]|eukprot:XP_013232647.1 cullin homog, putative [Eimeria tenella]
MGCCELRARLGAAEAAAAAAGAPHSMNVDGDISLSFSPFYHLVVSELQTICLLQFNSKETLTLPELAQHSGFPEAELARELGALCLPAAEILIKETVNGVDTFRVNLHFNSPHKRIQIPQAAFQTSFEGGSAGEAAGEGDLSHQLDAGIVRVLKRQSLIKHQELLILLTKTLNKPFDSSLLKKRIESLIDRDYIARDPHDSQAYRYVA